MSEPAGRGRTAYGDPVRPPERIVQFGTGRFLLGFLGDFVDRANASGNYAGSIVAVQSTGRERADLINSQGGRYTLALRGAEAGKPIESTRLLSCLSRALAADKCWEHVLELARSPDIELVVSNTTEAGLTLDLSDDPARPRTFPAKLAAFLVERFQAGHSGVVVLPCELVEANGDLLRSQVLALAQAWNAPVLFQKWIERDCAFPNTLVDRIVTGVPAEPTLGAIQDQVGFRDQMVTVAEPYALWAIEGGAEIKRRIGFAAANDAIIVNPDISRHREFKVRLLNGGHTVMAALAAEAGCSTVREALADAACARFVGNLLREEIGSTLPYDVSAVQAYAGTVLARWANPFLDHAWADIAKGYAGKFRIRVSPIIGRYAALMGRPPQRVAVGLAAYLSRASRPGASDGDPDAAAIANTRADRAGPEGSAAFVAEVLARPDLWGCDLSRVGGFAGCVGAALITGEARGFRCALEQG